MSERKITDVTGQIKTEWADGEYLPVIECMCGASFRAWEGFLLNVDDEDPTPCPQCGRKFYWRPNNSIYMVEDVDTDNPINPKDVTRRKEVIPLIRGALNNNGPIQVIVKTIHGWIRVVSGLRKRQRQNELDKEIPDLIKEITHKSTLQALYAWQDTGPDNESRSISSRRNSDRSWTVTLRWEEGRELMSYRPVSIDGTGSTFDDAAYHALKLFREKRKNK